jgi:amino acid adenylation domain-containing protein
LRGRLPEGLKRVVSVDGEREEIGRQREEEIRGGVEAENVAYVIYTSGSTGKPKGPLITHRGLCNVIQEQINAFDVRPGKKVLQFASLSFDTSVAQIFMALNSGATLFLLGQDPLYSQAGLIQFLRDNGITTADIGPTILGAFPAEEIPSLRTISTGGERCSRDVVNRWAPGRDFFNVYGLTETTICATIARCSEDYPYDPPIGRPIGNTTVYLLDRNMEIVPVGVPGELFIGGACLARGYMNHPDLTAERFIPDPFGNEPGARLFRTGDMGRYLPDGDIDYLGRADDQIKLRGLRIEPGEIEAAIRAHTEVDMAVVLAKAVGRGSRRLIAYVVPNRGAQIAACDLRAFLKESLPDFMIPSAFVLLDSFPLTVGGKVDRSALPDPDMSRPDLDQNFEMPRSDVERTVAGIWQQVLEVEKVGLHDNFFDLGGHSLHMIRVHDKLRDTYGGGLVMMDLFNHPTVSALARRIVEGQAAAQPSPERTGRASSRRESMRAQKQKRERLKAEKERAKAQRN